MNMASEKHARDSRPIRLQKVFLNNEKSCVSHLKEFQTRRPLSAALYENDLKYVLDIILNQIGLGVFDAIGAWFGRKHSDDLCIYFWPGYERVVGNQGRTVLLSSESRSLTP